MSLVVVTVVAMWHDRFDLRHRDDGQISKEKQEQSRKQPKATNEHPDIDHGWTEVRPTGRQKVATERSDRNHKSLKPHSDIYKDANDHHEPGGRSAPFDPEQLRGNDVAGNHDPIRPCIISKRAIDKRKSFVWVAAVPGDKKLNSISRTHHHPGRNNNLAHILQVAFGNQVLQLEQRARGHHQSDNHREPGENRTGHKVRWENRGMPTGHLRYRKVKTNDGMKHSIPAESQELPGSYKPLRSDASDDRNPSNPVQTIRR